MVHNLLSLLLLILSINLATSGTSTVVEAIADFKVFCEQDTYYIILGVSFKSTPSKNYYPFSITLSIPSTLSFKCMLEYETSRIYCFSVLSNKNVYIQTNDLLQLPYQFPKIDGIVWDYSSFIRKIYRKVWTSNCDCGKGNTQVIDTNQNLNTNTTTNSTIPATSDLFSATIRSLTNDHCGSGYLDKIQDNYLSFDMEVDFSSATMNELLKDPNGKNSYSVELLQNIWVPLLPPTDTEGIKTKVQAATQFNYAYCSLGEKITLKTMSKQTLQCSLPIPYQYLFKGNVKVASFYDKVFVKVNGASKNKIIKTVKINFSIIDPDNYVKLKLNNGASGIICPNKAIFTIDNKDTDIKMETYYPSNYKYTFSLKGTLSNGFTYQDGNIVPLVQTQDKIQFNLTVTDNLITEDDELEPEVQVDCVLSTNTLFNEKGAATILCLGNKPEKYGKNNNVDITLNWASKDNNNFDNIIIKWPKTFESQKKNIFRYELTGISLKQTNYGCSADKKSFNFYLYIYNLEREPKLNFNLNMLTPKSPAASCEIFDSSALKCSLNLKYKKLPKGSTVSLPFLGTELKTVSPEGNIIQFTMNNFTALENPHDFYITLLESCGENVIVGTFGGLGLSKSTTIIIIVLFICIMVGMISFVIYYIVWRIKFTYKRGKKLTLGEESKTGDGLDGVNKK